MKTKPKTTQRNPKKPTRISTKTDIRKKAFLKALEKSLGVVSDACKTIDIHRSTYYEWIAKDPEFRNEVEAIGELALDFAESKLFEMINGYEHVIVSKEGIPTKVKDAPNMSGIIFYLKTKGKKRGYVERSEVELSDKTAPDLSQLTTEEIKELLNQNTNEQQ